MLSLLETGRRCALAIAHPGHEIRMFGWLEAQRPRTYILTDGSGQKGIPRLDSSSKLIASTGATRGPIFGVMSDRQVYSQVLAGNADLFLRLADRLGMDWAEQEIDVVLGDACEGAIMTHDLWRGVIDRAVRIASELRGTSIENLAFSLESDPRDAPSVGGKMHRRMILDDASWRRKIHAAESYEGLQFDIQHAFSAWGKSAFRFETILTQPKQFNSIEWFDKPAYERHGETQVNAGVYQQVVRYREHVWQILAALQRGSQRGDKAA